MCVHINQMFIYFIHRDTLRLTMNINVSTIRSGFGMKHSDKTV